jgi:hypothetical protein
MLSGGAVGKNRMEYSVSQLFTDLRLRFNRPQLANLAHG